MHITLPRNGKRETCEEFLVRRKHELKRDKRLSDDASNADVAMLVLQDAYKAARDGRADPMVVRLYDHDPRRQEELRADRGRQLEELVRLISNVDTIMKWKGLNAKDAIEFFANYKPYIFYSASREVREERIQWLLNVYEHRSQHRAKLPAKKPGRWVPSAANRRAMEIRQKAKRLEQHGYRVRLRFWNVHRATKSTEDRTTAVAPQKVRAWYVLGEPCTVADLERRKDV